MVELNSLFFQIRISLSLMPLPPPPTKMNYDQASLTPHHISLIPFWNTSWLFFKTNHPMLGTQWWVSRNVKPMAWWPASWGAAPAAPQQQCPLLQPARISIDFLFVFSHQSFNETPLPAYDWNVFSMMAQAMRQILTFWRYEWHVCMGHHSHVVAKSIYRDEHYFL